MVILRNMTLRNKLVSIMMLTCIAALVLAGGAFIVWDQINARTSMVQNLSILTEMVADNCKAALIFEDAKDAEETLSSLHVQPSIIYACVYNEHGKVLAIYNRDKSDTSIHLFEVKGEGHRFSYKGLIISETVFLDKEKIGRVIIRSDLGPLYATLSRDTSIIVSILLIASLAAYFLVSKTQGVISKPILELAEVARAVSGEKDYSARATKRSNDEVGLLIEAFNQMLEQIQLRNSQLVGAKEKLEIRVEERTSELSSANKQLKQEVADRKEAEERQAELLEELEAINRELKDFAYVVSHDLKAPLRGIKTLIEWMSSDYTDKLDDKGKEQMELLSQQVKRMHGLIEGVLQYSRAGREDEERAEINLNELVSEVVETVMPPKSISITVENELPIIKCETTRIAQVFQNLLSNAVKYIDKPQGEIRIGCAEDGDYWRFSIADNGPGIEERHFERIFKIFKKLSDKDDFESTGIGLTIVKKVVKLYKGEVWVESEMGKGSTFFFTLSKQQVSEDAEKVLQTQAS